MLDRNTVIRHPHEPGELRNGKREPHPDPRVSVTIQDDNATVALFFDAATAFGGEAPLLEVRLTPPDSDEPFEPHQATVRLPLHVRYARASLRHDRADIKAALRALREVDVTRRGLSADFLRTVAQIHDSLIAEGEPHPVKALAAMQQVDKSTASRWISAARSRGYLPAR
jgi:hypothetical protein